ncbi:MAG TPA: AAA family ATPase, partial [Sporichthyaceae bacterium]|nr:AAA family ATPase [Sporichthyaceae bacterium]
MIELDGYRVLGTLASSESTLVLRCRSTTSGESVLVKLLRAEYPTPEQLARLRHEFDIATDLPPEWAVRALGVEQFGRRTGLVLTDTGGVSLAAVVPPDGFDLATFLRLAVSLVTAVAGLHQHGLIHRDLKPANVVVDEALETTRLTDFGLATRLTRVEGASTDRLEGTLAYLAPEQTGRLARSVDQRSDLYSLGVTLYQMLAGRLPFEGRSPLELIHAHLAVVPAAPATAPPGLAAIVLRLLAKAPEDRYQTAEGLLADLQDAAFRFKQTGTVPLFELGTRDRPQRLMIPERLFGRDPEIGMLTEQIAHAAAGVGGLVLLRGAAGIGKTALFAEVSAAVAAVRGRIAARKFDQYAPGFSAPKEVAATLVRQTLAEPAEQLAVLREELTAALGPNLAVMSDLVPELALIVGRQPPPTPLGAAEAQLRVTTAFVDFLTVFARPDAPLVIFLDDLQWAPGGNLHMLDRLGDPRLGHLLIIGAYRPEEVSEAHPLALKLAELPPDRVHTFPLEPLTTAATAELVEATLGAAHPELATWLHELTVGNPFYLRQVLESLATDGLLGPNGGVDMAAVRAHLPSGNVVDFLVGKLAELPEPTRHVLRYAALIGARFDLATLAVVTERPTDDLAAQLWPAITAGLVVGLDDRHELAAAGVDPRGVRYRFRHDRVQQAVHATIPKGDLPGAHLTVGQTLRGELDADEDRLFDVVGHLNAAIDLIADPAQRVDLARLNAAAAARAKESAGYDAAAAHFGVATTLLGEHDGPDVHLLRRSVLLGSGEVLAALGRVAEAEAAFATALQHAQGEDAAECLAVLAEARFGAGCFPEALDAAIDGLARLGRAPALDPDSGARAFAELLDPDFIDRLRGCGVHESGGEVDLAARLFASGVIAGYFTGSPTFQALTAAAVTHALAHGSTTWSSIPTGYAAMQAFRTGKLAAGTALAEVALDLVARLEEQLQGTTTMLTWAYCMTWARDAEEQLATYRRTFTLCHQAGAPVYAVYCLYEEASVLLLAGRDELAVEQCWRRLDDYCRFAVQMAATAPAMIDLSRRLSGTGGYEVDYLAIAEDNATSNTVVAALMASEGARYEVVLGRYEAGYAAGKAAERFYDLMAGVSTGSWLLSYYLARAVSAARLAETRPAADRSALLDEAAAAVEALRPYCEIEPRPWIGYLRVAEAELARAAGDVDSAALAYLAAIDHAGQARYTLLEAWATELLGRLYLEGGRRVGTGYLREARTLYLACAANGKVTALDAEFADLGPSFAATPGDATATGSTSTSDGAAALDLATVVKASQAIASELDQERIVERLVAISVENVGAERGAFVPVHDGEVILDADVAPATVVRYVARLGEPLVLVDIAADPAFGADPYVQSHHPRSVVAMPISRSGRRLGVLYLENRLLAGAFTEARLELLRLLSTQMAISLENARLYSGLEAEVAARTQELS